VGDRLAGKRALITGAGRGIGEASARLFAEHGARVAIADLRRASAEAVAASIQRAGGDAVAIEVDVRDEAACRDMVAGVQSAFGGLDVLHNCAATIEFAPAADLAVDSWRRVLDTNALGTWLACKASIPVMLEQGAGTIVNMCSVSGTHGQPAFAAYNASKGAVLALTRNLAVDYGPTIRVNCISPGPTDTPAVREAIAASPDPDAMLAEIEASNHIVRRLGRPTEIAYAALYLASDEASFCHGTNLLVAGGQTIQP
jgi:meso-butanediol dehydrogenase/(S,S)-butanediol dehydrogenase/diacetyl reductase